MKVLFVLIFVKTLWNCALADQRKNEEYWRLRSLDLGPCLQEGDAYCMRRVANSMCSKEKNECFCKPGYVSIQESYGITCKTLLTNLKCQVDSDCVHVSNSACHPGAGYCACPGGTIYVPQEHACRQAAETEHNPFCLKCRQVNGVCYHNPKQNNPDISYDRYTFETGEKIVQRTHFTEGNYQRLTEYLHKFPYGCNCPHNTGMLASTPKENLNFNVSSFTSTLTQFGESLPQWNFCKALLVELWSFCNDVDLLCRAKNSRCFKSGDNNGIVQYTCRCLPGYVPVFQKHLGYFECFRQLGSNQTLCSTCLKTGGYCYSMKDNGADAIGCLCPNDKSPTLSLANYQNFDFPKNEVPKLDSSRSQPTQEIESCADKLVQVYCSRHHIDLCYTPPFYSPYDKLREHLERKLALAIVTDSYLNYKSNEKCTLQPSSTPQNGGWNVTQQSISIWCITLDWRENSETIPCGLRVSEYMSGHLYNGFLMIVTDPEYRSIEPDLFFQFTCKTNNEVPRRVPGQIFERIFDEKLYGSIQELPWPKLDVNFNIRDDNGDSIQTVFGTRPIRLEAKLIDERNIFKAMTIEECYLSEWSQSSTSTDELTEVVFLHKGCPIKKQQSTSAIHIARPDVSVSHISYDTIVITKSPNPLNFNSDQISDHVFLNDIVRANQTAFEFPSHLDWIPNGKTKKIDRSIASTDYSLSPKELNSKLNKAGYRLRRLDFMCVFRICKQLAWCSWPSSCDSVHNELNSARVTFIPPSLRMLQRSTSLNIVEIIPTTQLPVKKQNKSKVCAELFCSSTLHVILLIGLVGILTCLMGLLGMILARRYRQRNHQDRPVRQPKSNLTKQPIFQPCNPILKMNSPNYPIVVCDAQKIGCCERWLTDHAYANPLLLRSSDVSNFIQMPPSPPTPSRCSCLGEYNADIFSQHGAPNYYTIEKCSPKMTSPNMSTFMREHRTPVHTLSLVVSQNGPKETSISNPSIHSCNYSQHVDERMAICSSAQERSPIRIEHDKQTDKFRNRKLDHMSEYIESQQYPHQLEIAQIEN